MACHFPCCLNSLGLFYLCAFKSPMNLACMQWLCLTIGLHPPPWSSRAQLYNHLHPQLFLCPHPPFPGKKKQGSGHPLWSLCIFWANIPKGRLWLMGAYWSPLSVCMYVWVRLRAHTHTPSHIHACRPFFHSQTRGCTLASSTPELHSRDQSSFPWEMMVKQSVNKDLCSQ